MANMGSKRQQAKGCQSNRNRDADSPEPIGETSNTIDFLSLPSPAALFLLNVWTICSSAFSIVSVDRRSSKAPSLACLSKRIATTIETALKASMYETKPRNPPNPTTRNNASPPRYGKIIRLSVFRKARPSKGSARPYLGSKANSFPVARGQKLRDCGQLKNRNWSRGKDSGRTLLCPILVPALNRNRLSRRPR